MAAASTVKMSDVLPWVDERQAAEMVAVHYGEPVVVARDTGGAGGTGGDWCRVLMVS